MWDDCFSFPDIMVRVTRNKEISVRFLDDFGTEQFWEHCSIDLSELLQHEIDHLDGILAVDRALPNSLDCQSIIPRSQWLENRSYYDSMVDYFV